MKMWLADFSCNPPPPNPPTDMYLFTEKDKTIASQTAGPGMPGCMGPSSNGLSFHHTEIAHVFCLFHLSEWVLPQVEPCLLRLKGDQRYNCSLEHILTTCFLFSPCVSSSVKQPEGLQLPRTAGAFNNVGANTPQPAPSLLTQHGAQGLG